MVGHGVCDPAIAANGNDRLLLSEDMGFGIGRQRPSKFRPHG